MSFPLHATDTLGAFFAVLVATLLVPLAAEKLRLPVLAALALAGALVGPRGLGIVNPEGAVATLGELGLLYAFFLAGAELAPVALRKGRAGQRAAALISFALPFGAAFAAGRSGLGATPQTAILIATAFAVRSTRPYPCVARLGIARSEAAGAAAEGASLSTALSIAVMTATILVTTHPQAHAESRSLAGFLNALGPTVRLATALALALAMYVALPALAARFFKGVRPDGVIEFIFVLALAFFCAFAADRIGMPAAAGAFLAGGMLRRFVPESSMLMGRLRFAGESLFVPFFLVYAGMSADLAPLFADERRIIALGAAFALLFAVRLAAAFATKIVLRLDPDEAGLVFGLSLNQGAAALGVLFVGLRLGLVSEALAGGALLLLVATGLFGPLVAKKTGGRLALRSGTASLRPEGEPDRVLVALGNPAALERLVELAFLLRGPDEEEAVYPVAVVPESGDTEEELARAENLLARAMVQATRAGVPIRPQTRVAVNVPEGILQAAEENRTRTLVLGWNRAPRLSSSFFGSVIDRVLQGGRGLVVVARVAKGGGKAFSRVSLVLPPLAERHPGFARGIAALSSLIRRSGAHLTIYAQSPHAEAARIAASRLRARGQTQVVELASWKSVTGKIRSQGSPHSAFVIFCSRPGGVAWHPAVEKLPHLLGEEFPEAPLLLFYLPEELDAAAPTVAGAAAPGAEEAVPPNLFEAACGSGRVLVAMRETAIADGVRGLLARAFGQDRRLLGRLAATFTEIAQKAPIELEPGVVLLHAHVAEVEEPVVLFGARPEGFRILALGKPARVLVVLCAPESQPPEAHLAALGEIARLFSKEGLAARLLAARSLDDL